ncbi:hypothetical protein VNO78_03474 [Psophocarpus tetragonolobus]|uniref:COBRA C-terminal domain-containing protein n=1 Tax=Psophocarpus tetragonolobus TaxID=3891 RepID=A0AAN9T1J0_PSOTE
MEEPGWRLGWVWKGDEVIWAMLGVEAMEQGNCTRFKGQQKPYCCEKEPIIIDLMPRALYNMQSANCCTGGLLTSITQYQHHTNSKLSYFSSFQMTYIKPSLPHSGDAMPHNFTLGILGYSCGTPFQVPPTKFTNDGHRWQQVLDTWNVTCIYSQFLASPTPKCCVSLSAFYNSTFVPCPTCSCNCQSLPGAYCVNSDKTSVLQLPHTNLEEPPSPVIKCSHHTCPIRVHWHVKQSYKEHCFNYQPLPIYGNFNDIGMFWGQPYYNDKLLAYGDNGNIQTKALLHKNRGEFTFKEGWAFPRKISFNGDECVMPSPNTYPRLPNSTHIATISLPIILFSMLLILSILFYRFWGLCVGWDGRKATRGGMKVALIDTSGGSRRSKIGQRVVAHIKRPKPMLWFSSALESRLPLLSSFLVFADYVVLGEPFFMGICFFSEASSCLHLFTLHNLPISYVCSVFGCMLHSSFSPNMFAMWRTGDLTQTQRQFKLLQN